MIEMSVSAASAPAGHPQCQRKSGVCSNRFTELSQRSNHFIGLPRRVRAALASIRIRCGTASVNMIGS
jgi:hypothetical protein